MIKKLWRKYVISQELASYIYESSLRRQQHHIDVLQAWQNEGRVYNDINFLPSNVRFYNSWYWFSIGVIWHNVYDILQKNHHNYLSALWYLLGLIIIICYSHDIFSIIYFKFTRMQKIKKLKKKMKLKKAQNV